MMHYNDEIEAYQMIDEYLEDVRRYLPNDIADDVIKELKTHIIDKAQEMGGVNVRNVYRIIKSLGDPRKLASNYVIGTEKKKLKFELGISEDLYPIFTKLVFWISLLIMIGYIVRIVEFAYESYNVRDSIINILMTFSEMILVLCMTVLFLYLALSFVSSNEELKKEFISAFEELIGVQESKAKKKKVQKIRIKRKEKTNSVYLSNQRDIYNNRGICYLHIHA